MPSCPSIPMRLVVGVLASCLVAAQPLALGAHGWGGSAHHVHGYGPATAAPALLAAAPTGAGGHDHEPADCALCHFVQQGREKMAVSSRPVVPDADHATTYLLADRLSRPLDDFSLHALGPRAPPVCA